MKKLLLLFSLLLFIVVANAQWTRVGDIPYLNHHSNGFGINGKGYIVQGEPDGQSENMMWEYDPKTDEWTTIGPIPAPNRRFSIGDDMDGKYYFGFGTSRNDMWEFDPVTKTYKELPSCPCEGRGHPAFVAHKGKIYMGSGSTFDGDLNDWWVYDFATEEWTQKQDIPGTVRHHPYQFGIDDAIYVGGGHRTNWLKFDINTEEWSVINNFPQGRVAGTQFSYGNKGFVLSGDRSDHSPLYDNQFLMYDPEEDDWFDLPFELEMHRWAPSSMIIDNNLYYFGGEGAHANQDERMWKFDLNYVFCLPPDNPYAPTVMENSAELRWNISPDGPTDTLQWREKGTSDWNVELGIQSGIILSGLESCTEYEYRVNTSCSAGISTYSKIAEFKTRGCEGCVDYNFCDVSEDFTANTTFIERVKIKDYENQTGRTTNQGYHSYPSFDQIQLSPGESFEVEIEPTFSGGIRRGSCKSWMDFDGDGEFESDELVIDEFGFTTAFTKTIEVPADAQAKVIQMRIMLEIAVLQGPCQGTVFSDGEVEDYCVTILENTSDTNGPFDRNLSEPNIFPNPNEGVFNLEYSNGERFEVYDYSGRLILNGDLKTAFAEKAIQEIRMEGQVPGLYIVKVIGEKRVDTISVLINK